MEDFDKEIIKNIFSDFIKQEEIKKKKELEDFIQYSNEKIIKLKKRNKYDYSTQFIS